MFGHQIAFKSTCIGCKVVMGGILGSFLYLNYLRLNIVWSSLTMFGKLANLAFMSGIFMSSLLQFRTAYIFHLGRSM